MNLLIDPLKEVESYIELIKSIEGQKSPIIVSGIIDEAMPHLLYCLKEDIKRPILIVGHDESKCERIREGLEDLVGLDPIYFERKDKIAYELEAHSNEIKNSRIKCLNRIVDSKDEIIIASVESLLDKLASREDFLESRIHIDYDSQFEIEWLSEKLVKIGYERLDKVESPGQFAIRGGIIDVYPLNRERPVRIEFFDIEVDSLREFDPFNQRTIENIDSLVIAPADEVLISQEDRKAIIDRIEIDLKSYKADGNFTQEARDKADEKFKHIIDRLDNTGSISNLDLLLPYLEEDRLACLLDYLAEDTIIILDDYRRIEESLDKLDKDFNYDYLDFLERGVVLKEYKKLSYGKEEYLKKLERFINLKTTGLLAGGSSRAESLLKFNLKAGEDYHGKLDLFTKDLIRKQKDDYKILIFASSDKRMVLINQMLGENLINSRLEKTLEGQMRRGEIVLIKGNLKKGFEYLDGKFKIYSEGDIFGSQKRKGKKSKKTQASLRILDLKKGDLLVHENHGIGRFDGLVRLNIQGIDRDYINIKYKGSDKIYIPIDQMNLIQKYKGGDREVSLNSLSSGEWSKTKTRVKKAIENMAEDLLNLYARRQESKGFSFEKDSPWQIEFEDKFPYEETQGQLTAMAEIKEDMESDRPMDRLLCGDAGYGKTELALRAAFKAVLSNKQVAFLAPTTILAEQHYQTMLKRFEGFPVTIEVLSRFKTRKEQEEIIKKLELGLVDILVGTHRILSEDVKFQDLGLLIVDEEQRFGVKDKEKYKAIKENLDILTLSATPIPRTLHMSLSGIRDMSVLDQPPHNRYPVQTYVLENRDEIIRDAILKEISRGGQVFYVYNRVGTIEKEAEYLKRLVPEASIEIGHGQMNEKKLEKVMLDFLEKKFDILLSTTIIETGIDLPNINTIIIQDADKMGLSQLYQLRGRVGRSNRLAFGYFLYKEDKVLSELAEKRLRAIKEFTEFGSGFKIAMRDLEIRGAGNLLGLKQHGQIEAIGYDLYVKFLEKAIRKLKGQVVEEDLDTTIDLRLDSYIGDEYISDKKTKMEIYKRIGDIRNLQDYNELLDEILDRFGDIDRPGLNLMDISYIRALASQNGIISLVESDDFIQLNINRLEDIKSGFISYLEGKYKNLSFTKASTAYFRYYPEEDKLRELKLLIEDIDTYNKGKDDRDEGEENK